MNIRTYIFLGLLSLVMRVQAERNISSPLFLDLVNRIDNNYSEDEVISRLQGMYCLVDLKIEDDDNSGNCRSAARPFRHL